MGSSRPSLVYNSVTARWEVTGRNGVLLATIPDTSQPLGQIRRFVGSTDAIGDAIGSLTVVTATLTGTSGNVNRGDVVFATAKTRQTSGVLAGVSVPSNNLMLLHIIGSLPAMGWDVISIRSA